MSYKSLEIWKLADELVIEVHSMTLSELPKFELYETGSQIRRSMKSVKANIVEGYGRRYYPKEYYHFLLISQASLDETIDHLETLYKTKSLKDADKYDHLHLKLNQLGKMLNVFIQLIKKDAENGTRK